MIESGDFQLNELPKQCGFSSRSAFYAAFLKEEGQSPLYYQAIYRAILQRKKKKRGVVNKEKKDGDFSLHGGRENKI